MKIHFGCFASPTDGWINTDVTPHLFVAKIPGLALFMHKAGIMDKQRFDQHKAGLFRHVRYHNVTKPWKFDSGSAEAIFSSHVVEHLYYDQAVFCFSECLRVLRKGGILRIAVPDLDQFICDYPTSDTHEWVAGLFESQQANNKNAHHWMYNEKSLRELLLKIGFSSVKRCEFRQGDCPDVESIDNRPASLFVEALK